MMWLLIVITLIPSPDGKYVDVGARFVQPFASRMGCLAARKLAEGDEPDKSFACVTVTKSAD